MALDRISLKMIAVLQRDGRLTNRELADRVGLTPSPCLQRLRKLEADKVITGYGARIDAGKVSEHVVVLMEITMKDHDLRASSRFERYMREQPQIVTCYKVSGAHDYQATFIARGTDDYLAQSDRILADCPEIAGIRTQVVLSTVKEFTGFPIELLSDHAGR